MSKRLVGGAAAVLTLSALAAITVSLWPDVRRYLRIRRM
ncbi:MULTISPECIES: DUF6893 family small protein [Streptomyces]|uniref:DUF6893 family small protein n=1 Tax=Streptomyces heliomycini TaxID=284032 RepID=A0ABV5LB40_9ACTN